MMIFIYEEIHVPERMAIKSSFLLAIYKAKPVRFYWQR